MTLNRPEIQFYMEFNEPHSSSNRRTLISVDGHSLYVVAYYYVLSFFNTVPCVESATITRADSLLFYQ